MKKIGFLLSLLVLLSAFTCENEPLEGDFVSEEDMSCAEASQATATAATAFIAATDDNYTELCTAYKEALENQIAACGDDTGNLQLAIDALGNCTNGDGPDPCELAAGATATACCRWLIPAMPESMRGSCSTARPRGFRSNPTSCRPSATR